MGRTAMEVDDMADAEEFLLHYQLQHDPFVPRPAGFRFFTPGRKPVLAQLHHMAHFSEQLQVVVGPEGAGKTLLRQAMVASCNRDKVQCVVSSGREYADAAGLERLICQAMSCSDMPSLLERAEQLHATGMQLYLVIDDAHHLEQEAVQMLAELSQSGRAAPRVFLFAEETIVAALEAVELPGDSAWLHLVELQPLTLEETRGYLSQRLEAAGQGIELLDDGQVARIHEQSAGWPADINRVARQVMMEEVQQPIRAERPRGVVLPVRSLVALVLVGAGVAIAWMMGGDEPEPTRTVLTLPDQVATVDVTDSARAPVLQMPGDSSSALERIVEEPDGEPLAAAQVTRAPAASAEGELPAPVALPEPPQRDAPELVEAPSPVPAARAERAPDTSTERAEPAEPSAPATEQETARVAADAPPPAPVTPPAAAATGADRAGAGQYHQAGWYRQRPTTEYALQLLGTRSRQAALEFVSRQVGVADLGLFETEHEGKPWFVVTQGAYSTRTQAMQGIAALPAALQKQNPWPRSMASIQQSLR